MKKLLTIIGARPQFIKHAPVEIAARDIFETVTVHTGQHYDYNMSQVFFEQLQMSKPDYNLEVGSGLHGEQTGRMMIDLEPILINERPDFVLVYGDTNSTVAGALTASKLHIPLVHIEAGLRSFNRLMPEEINRVVTDHLSDILFAPTKTGTDNLRSEGIVSNVHLIGDVMYDMIKISERNNILKQSDAAEEPYIFATIHRPYNTDSPERMRRILEVFEKLPLSVKFAIHPRTYKKIEEAGFKPFRNIVVTEPLSYFDSISTIHNSTLVITDSGGIQKEAYMLKKKCITLRSETEWIETLVNGWNTLVFEEPEDILIKYKEPVGNYIQGLYGNGNAAHEIIGILKEYS